MVGPKTNVRHIPNQHQFVFSLLADALVILDLFQDLADHLKSLDLTDQRQLMLTKYLLLNRKVAVGSVEAYRVVAKALQEGVCACVFVLVCACVCLCLSAHHIADKAEHNSPCACVVTDGGTQ